MYQAPLVNYYLPMEYPELETSFPLPLVIPAGDRFQWNPVESFSSPIQGFSFSFALALAAAEHGIFPVEV